MKRQYYKAVAKKRQTLHRHYAQYMNMMPAHDGGVLILRGIAGCSTAVEEVQGCALRSEAGNSVVEYMRQLLLHYGTSLRLGKTVAPFVSPDVNTLATAVRALFDQIRGRCPEGSETTDAFISIRGHMDAFDTFMKKMESGRLAPTTQSNDAQPVPAGLSAAVDSPAAEPEVAPPAAPASQDDAGDEGDLEGDGDPEHGDVTEQPISASVNASASEARENMRRKMAMAMAKDVGPLEEIRHLSENGLSDMVKAAINASDDAKESSTSNMCTTHVNRAQTAVGAVLRALTAAREAFSKLSLPQNQNSESVQQHMNKLAEAAGTAEAAVEAALAHQREVLQKEEEVAAAAAEAAAKLAEAEKADAEKRLEAERQAAEKREAEARKRPVVDDDDDDDDQPELKKLKATDYFTDERLGKKDAKVNVSDAHQVSSTLERSGRVLLKVPRGAMKSLVDAFCPFAAAETTPWTAVFERDVLMMGDDIPADLLKLWPRRQSVVKERGKAWAGVGKESVQPFLTARSQRKRACCVALR
jgi:hypothetical protein